MHEKWDDYYIRGWGVDPELARERLNFLKHEQERAMFPDWNRAVDRDDEPLFYSNSIHAFNRSCQCKKCVKLHTITMQDREFLRTMGIVWSHSNTCASSPSRSTRATRKG